MLKKLNVWGVLSLSPTPAPREEEKTRISRTQGQSLYSTNQTPSRWDKRIHLVLPQVSQLEKKAEVRTRSRMPAPQFTAGANNPCLFYMSRVLASAPRCLDSVCNLTCMLKRGGVLWRSWGICGGGKAEEAGRLEEAAWHGVHVGSIQMGRLWGSGDRLAERCSLTAIALVEFLARMMSVRVECRMVLRREVLVGLL